MKEKEYKKFVKEFSMWAGLPVPKATVFDEGRVSSTEMEFALEPDYNSEDRLKFLVIHWLLILSQNPTYTNKIAGLIMDRFWPTDEKANGEKVNE